MIDLQHARPYLRAHNGKLFVVKVGGECLASAARVRRVAEELSTVQALGARLVVVHGAGPQTDALQRALGEEPRKVHGRRVTSPLALRALRQATLGELNPELVLALCAQGTPAIGLCAAGADMLRATRRPPVVVDGEVIDFGEVGDVARVDVAPLRALLATGLLPVLAPPASDGAGGFLNVNADVAAARIAVALGARKLVLLTGADGVLLDPEDPESVASTLSLEELDALEARGALRDGMRVKAEAVRAALAGGVTRVHVVSGKRPGALLEELYTAQGAGTLVTAHAELGGELDEAALGNGAPVEASR